MTLNKSLFVCLDLHVASGTCGCSERASGADHFCPVIRTGPSLLEAGVQPMCPTSTPQIINTPYFFRIRSTDGGEDAAEWSCRNLSCFDLMVGCN